MNRATIRIVAPAPQLPVLRELLAHLAKEDPNLEFVAESRPGLSAAINHGIDEMPFSVRYVGWLGDDDLLSPGSLMRLRDRLDSELSFTYGSNLIIDENSRPQEVLKARRFARVVSRYIGNLYPQPGSLLTRALWNELGGLDEKLKTSMDLDLFLRADLVGDSRPVKEVVAAYRWHAGSISSSKSEYREDTEIRLNRFNSRAVKIISRSPRFFDVLLRMLIHKATHVPVGDASGYQWAEPTKVPKRAKDDGSA